MQERFYLKCDGEFLAVADSEEKLVNHAATMDLQDYEIREEKDLSEGERDYIVDYPPEVLL